MAFLAPLFGTLFGTTAAAGATAATVGATAAGIGATAAGAGAAGAVGTAMTAAATTAGAVSTGGFLGGISLSQIGSGLSILGSIGQSNAIAQAAEYNAAIARAEGAAEEARLRREARRTMGSIRSGIGKSGVTTEGTPLLVLAESAQLAELDALTARWNGENQANLYQSKARAAKAAIPFNVGSSLLTSFG